MSTMTQNEIEFIEGKINQESCPWCKVKNDIKLDLREKDGRGVLFVSATCCQQNQYLISNMINELHQQYLLHGF